MTEFKWALKGIAYECQDCGAWLPKSVSQSVSTMAKHAKKHDSNTIVWKSEPTGTATGNLWLHAADNVHPRLSPNSYIQLEKSLKEEARISEGLKKLFNKTAEEGTMKEKKQEPKITHKLTLDEYDELTTENQILGAQLEREAIITHLMDIRSQVMGIKVLTSRQDLASGLMDFYDGITGAVDAIRALPNYENRVGCPECDGWD